MINFVGSLVALILSVRAFANPSNTRASFALGFALLVLVSAIQRTRES